MDNQPRDTEPLKFSQMQFLTWQATLGFSCSLGEPNAAYSLTNTSKGLSEAAITYTTAIVKEQRKVQKMGVKNIREGIQKPLENIKAYPI